MSSGTTTVDSQVTEVLLLLLQHYHSMEVFSHFEIVDQRGNRVVEGHKVEDKKSFCDFKIFSICQASFCLEDNDCQGVDPHYDCENYGDQVNNSNIKSSLITIS